jgi:spermidine synthase
MDTFTEHSEADATTTYPLTERVYVGCTTTGTNVVIADSPAYGRMLFLDGELQSAAADEHIYHETLVHPAMALAATRRRVLVVGGGEGATVREVNRWSGVERVDWVDYDGELVQLCRQHLKWAPYAYSHPLIRYMAADIRGAWSNLLTEYDVIILDLPDPDGDTGYLYSDEFWADVKGRLAPGGRLVTHCGPVRPFGDIGAGFQRVRAAMGAGDVGFYSIGIPSFQGDWGFWLWCKEGAPFREDPRLPLGLRVVDASQMHTWATRPLVWRSALQQQFPC